MNPLVSVVICTHNRAACVRQVLATLNEQTVASREYEVLVVDNGSSDETPDVVRHAQREGPNVRYLLERRLGSSHARNLGWREATGRYVAFLDDDCKAPEQWLAVAGRIIDELAPAAFGGPIFPFYDMPRPPWYRDEYVTHKPGNEAVFLEPQQFGRIFGGNMFVARELMEPTGGFDGALGPKGGEAGYGEDTALMQRIAQTLGLPVYYDPDLYVYHLVRREKLYLRFWMKASFEGGRTRYRLGREGAQAVPGRPRLLLAGARTVGRLAATATRAVAGRDRATYPYARNYLFEEALPHVRRLGWLHEAFWRRGGNPNESARSSASATVPAER